MVNILIADDNIYFAKILMDLINSDNVKVCNIAINGKETLDILQSNNNIDLILLDSKMPIYSRERHIKYTFEKVRKEI